MDRNRSILTLVSLAGFAFLAAGTTGDKPSTSSSSTSAPTSAAPPQVALPPMPADQERFCQAVQESARAYDAMQSEGANQFKLSKLRSTRAAALKQAVPTRAAKDWVGVINHLSTTGDGEGVLGLKLPCGGEVKTWNNSFSDIQDGTLIKKNSALYDTVADLKEGVAVRFSGKFFADDKNGIKESSLSETGSMKEPEFITRFSAVTKL